MRAVAVRRSGAHRIALLAAAAMTIVACAQVIGASGHLDAVQKLCSVCSDTLPDCSKTLNAKLAEADDADVAAWLETYSELGCKSANCTTTALECFYSAPGVCAPLGQACGRSAACCGFDFQDARKGAGCCAAQDGQCCDLCLTCAEAIGVANPDLNTVCLSHLATLKAVVACEETTCMVQCLASKATCDECLKKKCGPQIDACNQNVAP